MDFYARKIQRSKWIKQLSMGNGEIRLLSLDLFERELKAEKRDISLWRIDETSKDDIRLVLSLFGEKIASFQYILISEEDLNGFSIVQSSADAKTALKGVEQYHYNIVDVNLSVFERFLEMVSKLVTQSTKYENVTESEIRRLISSAVEHDRLEYSNLDIHLQASLAKDNKLTFRPPIPQCPRENGCKACKYSLICERGDIQRQMIE